MAAVTTTALSLGLAGYQTYQGIKNTNKAQDALNNFKRQDLSNPYENMQISTVGSDALKEASSVTSATMLDALSGYDSRAIFGAIPKIQAATNRINKEIQIGLDEQVTNRNYAIAGDEVAKRNMRENRDNMDISGLGNLLEVGRQDTWNGMRGLTSAMVYGANNIDFTKGLPKVSSVKNSLEPAGIVPYSTTPTATIPTIYNPNNGF